MAEDNRLNDQTIYKVSVFPFNITYSSHFMAEDNCLNDQTRIIHLYDT